MPATTEVSPPLANLETHEHVMAAAMLQKAGELAVNAVVNPEAHTEEVRSLNQEQYDMLVENFGKDPKESLAWARESLLAIASDERLTPQEREEHLDSHLDAYLSLTLKLDHDAFPPTKDGEVGEGVVDYVPDGFSDMGRQKSLDPSKRDREMLHVDKKALFDLYRPTLKALFSKDYSGLSSEQKKKAMMSFLAKSVYFDLLRTNGEAAKNMGGGTVELANVSEGVCRHQALAFQVLAQAAGLKTGIIKSDAQFGDRNPEPHSSNIVRVDGKWFLLDVTNPDGVDLENENGERVWKPGIIPIDAPPSKTGITTYEGETPVGHQHRKYIVHNRAFWTITEAAA
ncbi:MAG TPA: EDR1-related protein [Candidatus Saccharimonadales bacterium]|nr:EDR1-related protein [Candidatus Saccharimonadales bacterium]